MREELRVRQEVIAADQPFVRRLRTLATDRLDSDVFNLIRPVSSQIKLEARDLIIVAAVLSEGARLFADHIDRGKPDDDLDAVVQVVSSVLGNAELPGKPSPERAFREYFEATVRWCQVLRFTHYVDRFWDVMERLLGADMRSFPDMREGLVSLAADIGRRTRLPDAIERHVLVAADRPYFFIAPANYLKVLGYALHHRIRHGDFAGVSGPWLAAWMRHFSVTNFEGSDRKVLFDLKDDISRRLNAMFRASNLVLLRSTSLSASLVLLLIKLDCRLQFADLFHSRMWIWFLKRAFSLLDVDPMIDVPQRRKLRSFVGVTPAARPLRGLSVLDEKVLKGTKRDVLVTRVQGGIGDLIAMRPGLLEMRRRLKRGRVIFATNRSFFPAFSVSDPIELVDIESTVIDTRTFGRRWINMSDCPATRAEAKELPRLRTGRVDIFASALGVRFWWFDKRRVRRILFPPEAAARADELASMHSTLSRQRVGIQLRSAETYKDVPVMLDVARKLTSHYEVFVFDSRPIPRQDGDRFVSVDREPMPVAMALASKMDLVIAPDSSFLHVAGSNGVRCLLLTGPSDGKVRRKPYPTVRFMDVRDQLGCIPCWRNEFQKCALSESFTSTCMMLLTVEKIEKAVRVMLGRSAVSVRPLHDGGRV